jgi:hypothetical protein
MKIGGLKIYLEKTQLKKSSAHARKQKDEEIVGLTAREQRG